MRHRSGQRKLNITDGAHRIAMLRNISNSLIEHERIRTTVVRAKELRRFVEPLITMGKSPSVANRRLVFSRLLDRGSVVKLFNDIGVRVANRPGGYVRILKHGFRAGDNAPMALVELVDRRVDIPEIVEFDDKSKKPKKGDAATEMSEFEDKKAGGAVVAESDEGAEMSAPSVTVDSDAEARGEAVGEGDKDGSGDGAAKS